MSAYARRPLYLASDNPNPLRREDSLGYRMGTLAQLWGAVGFALCFWWSIGAMVRAMFGLG